jgi:hypothetical protein
MAAGGGLKLVFDRTNSRPRGGGRGQLGWVIIHCQRWPVRLFYISLLLYIYIKYIYTLAQGRGAVLKIGMILFDLSTLVEHYIGERNGVDTDLSSRLRRI